MFSLYLEKCSSLKYFGLNKAPPRKYNQHKLYDCMFFSCQSESTLYRCLNVKELLARSRREIWRLSDCNWTWTENHLVCKRTLNHLAKLAISLQPVWPNGWVFFYELSGSEFKSSCSHLTNYMVNLCFHLLLNAMRCEFNSKSVEVSVSLKC